jgi:hypothetical protein
MRRVFLGPDTQGQRLYGVLDAFARFSTQRLRATADCDVLDITDRGRQVVIRTAVPGSPSEEALRLLSVIGTQRMDVAHWRL